MSDAAREYARDLGPDRVTRREKEVVKAIAEYHQERYHSANVALETLCADILIDRRYLRRLIRRLEDLGILGYVPARGAGNYGCFYLPEFEENVVGIAEKRGKKGVNGGQKGGSVDTRN